MKERLGGRPASVAKTWAVRGKKRLQEIRNLAPKRKERQRQDSFFVFNQFQVKGKRDASRREGRSGKLFLPLAPAAASRAGRPGSHECERSRAAEDRARGGDGKKKGTSVVPAAFGATRYCCKQTEASPLQGQARHIKARAPAKAKKWLARTRPEHLTCTRISRAPFEFPGHHQCQPFSGLPSKGRHPPPQNFGVLGDPLRSCADASACLSPHWPRRPWRARGRGRDGARAPAEREAAAAPGGRARRGREPPRARRGHARAPAWHSGRWRAAAREAGREGRRGLRLPSPCSGPRAG